MTAVGHSDIAPTAESATPSWWANAADIVLWRQRPAWTLALVRILYGFVLLGWTITTMLDAPTFLTENGAVPVQFADRSGWTVLDLDTDTMTWIALGVLVIASLAIIAGAFPGVALLLGFLLMVAIQRRDPLILNSGDLILRNLALLLAFCPTGAALSLDRLRREGRQAMWTSPMVAPWGLRLVQLQIVVVYFFAFWSKSGVSWRSGTAVSTALRLDDLQRFAAPWFMVDNVLVVATLTWGALVIELALAMLLWSKPLRPFLIMAAITLHVFIDGLMLVGFFGPVMVVGLLSFVDAAWLDSIVARRCRRETVDFDGTSGSVEG